MNVEEKSNINFEAAKNKIIGNQRLRQGIGTLQEKTVHAVLKNYYAPDEDMHEIPIENFVADIYTGSEIIEIQSAHFYKLRDKLTTFLALYPVTVVYPIPHHKWLIWIDEETGELSKPRKSPVTGTVYQAFRELYRIKQYLTHPNIRFCFPLIDLEEYRLLNGWSQDKKKGSCRYDRIPIAIADEIRFECPQDYLQLIPYDMPEPFTVKDFGQKVKLNKKDAGIVLHILCYLQIIEKTGKKGNAFTYRVMDD